MSRATDHLAASTSTISLDLLQAAKIEEPLADGWAQVGEHESSPCFGGSIPCPPISIPFMPGTPAFAARAIGGSGTPHSLPLVSRKWRETFKLCVSISTSMSSIMHAE